MFVQRSDIVHVDVRHHYRFTVFRKTILTDDAQFVQIATRPEECVQEEIEKVLVETSLQSIDDVGQTVFLHIIRDRLGMHIVIVQPSAERRIATHQYAEHLLLRVVRPVDDNRHREAAHRKQFLQRKTRHEHTANVQPRAFPQPQEDRQNIRFHVAHSLGIVEPDHVRPLLRQFVQGVEKVSGVVAFPVRSVVVGRLQAVIEQLVEHRFVDDSRRIAFDAIDGDGLQVFQEEQEFGQHGRLARSMIAVDENRSGKRRVERAETEIDVQAPQDVRTAGIFAGHDFDVLPGAKLEIVHDMVSIY